MKKLWLLWLIWLAGLPALVEASTCQDWDSGEMSCVRDFGACVRGCVLSQPANESDERNNDECRDRCEPNMNTCVVSLGERQESCGELQIAPPGTVLPPCRESLNASRAQSNQPIQCRNLGANLSPESTGFEYIGKTSDEDSSWPVIIYNIPIYWWGSNLLYNLEN